MFDVIAMRLLAGKFLCETTAPEAFRALEEDAMRNDVDAYLRRIGRRLACTAGGYAYYMAFERIGTDERTEVKRLFAFELPVILFGDIDPASLVEASRFPGVCAITVPADPLAAFKEFGNGTLYTRQVGQVGPAFEQLLDSASPGLRAASGWVHAHRKGLVQESMIGRDVRLSILTA